LLRQNQGMNPNGKNPQNIRLSPGAGGQVIPQGFDPSTGQMQGGSRGGEFEGNGGGDEDN